MQYNKPVLAVIVGVFFNCFQGIVLPVIGMIQMKIIFAMFEEDAIVSKTNVDQYSIYLLILAFTAGFT